MLVEAAKKAKAKAKSKSAGKKKSDKPKVESPVQDAVDPNTGQPIEVTKPAKAMTGNPANMILVYPNTDGQTSPVDPRNPMRNSQTQMIQNSTEKHGMLLSEYIDYARGVIVNSSGQLGPLNTPPIPIVAARDTGNLHKNQTGNIGMDNTGSEDDIAPGPTAQMGDVNERLRRQAQKRWSHYDATGSDTIDYAHTTHDDGVLFEDADFYSPVSRARFDGAPVTHDGPRYRVHQWGSTGHIIVDKQKNQSMWITPEDHNYITHTMIGRDHSTPKMDMEGAAGAFWNDYKNKRHVRNLD
jgi:hypothetical protein